MHEDLFEELQNAIENKESDNLAYAAPRGNAKSTLVSFAVPIWVAVYKKKHYTVIVSDTTDQATDFLSNIRAEFEDNDLLIDDFGDQEGFIWTTQDLVLRDGDVRIQALGAGKRVRGRRFKQWRPDLIICDDLENDENIQSADQRKKLELWYQKALSKAGDERTDKVIVGTILHYDSLLSKLLVNPTFSTKKYQAVIKWSASPLWVEWERLITNLDDPKRMATAYDFFKKNEHLMLMGTEVLWKEKESYYSLMVQRISDGPAAFSSEKQNEPLSDDDRRFMPEWIQYYDDEQILGKDLKVLGSVDPSMGKSGGDYSAIITLGVDTNGQVYVLDADIAKRHPDIIAADVIEKNRRFKYQQFVVEENQFQEYFKDTLINKVNELWINGGDKVSVNIIGKRAHSDKILRIQSLQPLVKNGTIKFRREQQKLIEQLVNFPSAANDDGPDALELAVSLINQSGVADYYKAKSNENKTTPESYLSNANIQRIAQSVSTGQQFKVG